MRKELLNQYRELWDEWEVRGCILFSLLLQIFLTFFASFRKQKTKMAKFFRPIIWLAYLTADAVAIFALGLLSRSLDPSINYSSESDSPATSDSYSDSYSYSHSYNDLLAFWAPFLLLHLGGPDTITAFALEDNELWLRHLLWLCVEVTVAGYVFMISLPNNSLLLATLLVFVAGIIRYAERTWALYLGSNVGFKGLIPEKNLKDEGYYSRHIDWRTGPGHEKLAAYGLFQTLEFKYLIADLVLPSGNYGIHESCQIFLDREHEEAFRIMDIELGFAYDILYTKAQVVHKTVGYVTRAICFICVLVSFLLFRFRKPESQDSDVKITYALLGGAMVLDVVALINLIFSDWTFVFLLHKHPWLSGLRSSIRTITTYHRRLELKYISQYDLISSSCTKHERSSGMKIQQKLSQSWLAKKNLNFFHTYDKKVSDELKKFIFDELKEKAKMVEKSKEQAKKVAEETPKEVEEWKEKGKKKVEELKGKGKKKVEELKEKGKKVEELEEKGKKVEELEEKAKKKVEKYKKKVEELEEMLKKVVEELEEKAKKAATNVKEISKKLWSCRGSLALEHNESLKWTVDEVEFVESILLWHIATHGCYHRDKDINENQGRAPVERRASKVISEYMVYLLVVHPSMISSIEGIKQIKLREACEGLTSCDRGFRAEVDRIYEASRPPSPDHLKRTYELFPDACYLVQILANMGVEERWQAISKVWVELLAHAASQCKANYHAKCLSRGGELLTYVWFLMAHLGSGQHYYEHTQMMAMQSSVPPRVKAFCVGDNV